MTQRRFVTGPAGTHRAMGFDDIKGKAKEAAGDITDDKGLENEGKVDQWTDTAKDKVGDVADKVKDVVNRD
jgi:uncharacterized protein YjbJ (UPF0337 family)